MKKFLATLLLIAILVSCTAALAATKFYTVKKNARVYEYKNGSYHKTPTIIHKGSIAEANKGSRFARIKIDGEKRKLYVYTNTLADAENKKATKQNYKYSAGGTGKSKKTDADPTPDKGYSRVYVKKGKKVNVRKYPSLQGKAIGASLKGGKWVTYLKEYQKDSRGIKFFHVIDSNGRKGWVSEEYTYRVK